MSGKCGYTLKACDWRDSSPYNIVDIELTANSEEGAINEAKKLVKRENYLVIRVKKY